MDVPKITEVVGWLEACDRLAVDYDGLQALAEAGQIRIYEIRNGEGRSIYRVVPNEDIRQELARRRDEARAESERRWRERWLPEWKARYHGKGRGKGKSYR